MTIEPLLEPTADPAPTVAELALDPVTRIEIDDNDDGQTPDGQIWRLLVTFGETVPVEVLITADENRIGHWLYDQWCEPERIDARLRNGWLFGSPGVPTFEGLQVVDLEEIAILRNPAMFPEADGKFPDDYVQWALVAQRLTLS